MRSAKTTTTSPPCSAGEPADATGAMRRRHDSIAIVAAAPPTVALAQTGGRRPCSRPSPVSDPSLVSPVIPSFYQIVVVEAPPPLRRARGAPGERGLGAGDRQPEERVEDREPETQRRRHLEPLAEPDRG